MTDRPAVQPESAEHVAPCTGDPVCLCSASEAPSAPRPSVVGGEHMERGIGDFVLACEAQILVEQERACPDNALIAVLCDAVRLTREMGRLATSPIRPSAPRQPESVELEARAWATHVVQGPLWCLTLGESKTAAIKALTYEVLPLLAAKAEAEALAEERAGLLTITVELAQRYLDERNAAREVADALAVDLTNIQRAMAYPLQNKASILTVIDAALALHAKLKESEKR